ncbi:MAG: Ig domain-containing protein [Anaeromyxobacter sp.]
MLQRRSPSRLPPPAPRALALAALALAGCAGAPPPAPAEPAATTSSAPRHLAYAESPVICTLGRSMREDLPSHEGGQVTGYTISPPLPPGLHLDPVTGAIAGTPRAPGASRHTVTARNAAGAASTILYLTVAEPPPAALRYAEGRASYARGARIRANLPAAVGGRALAWSVAPALPPGLELDRRTGAIRGTPTLAALEATYVVTARGASGAASAELRVEVTDSPAGVVALAAQP